MVFNASAKANKLALNDFYMQDQNLGKIIIMKIMFKQKESKKYVKAGYHGVYCLSMILICIYHIKCSYDYMI